MFEGDSAEIVEILENRKLAPVPWLRVESSISPYLCFKKSDDVDIRHDQFHKAYSIYADISASAGGTLYVHPSGLLQAQHYLLNNRRSVWDV